MNDHLSLTAKIARLETATKVLAAYIGYLTTESRAENKKAEPNVGRLEALAHQLDLLLDEQRAISPGNLPLINRVIYVHAPLIKAMNMNVET